MTAAAIAAAAIFAYPLAAAVLLVHVGRRVDTAFARDMQRVLRSRTPGGSGEDAGSRSPALCLPTAGGDARPPGPSVAVARPLAPSRLAGAVVNPQHAAPARPPQGTVHG